jgi:tRNA dimethylallyltransferase
MLEKIKVTKDYNIQTDLLDKIKKFIAIYRNPVIIVTGPTGSGKSSLAHILSNHLDTRLISADSRQIYKDLNVGSNKPFIEDHCIMDGYDTVKVSDNNNQYLYWQMDTHSLSEDISVQKYREECRSMFIKLHNQNILPLVVGGSIHWIKMLVSERITPYYISDIKIYQELCKQSLEDLQKEFINQYGENILNSSDWNNSRRLSRAIEYKLITGQSIYTATRHIIDQNNYLIFQTEIDADLHRLKLRSSIKARIQNGWIDETEFIIQKYGTGILDKVGLGYRIIGDFVINGRSGVLDELIEKLVISEMNYSRKQKI